MSNRRRPCLASVLPHQRVVGIVHSDAENDEEQRLHQLSVFDLAPNTQPKSTSRTKGDGHDTIERQQDARFHFVPHLPKIVHNVDGYDDDGDEKLVHVHSIFRNGIARDEVRYQSGWRLARISAAPGHVTQHRVEITLGFAPSVQRVQYVGAPQERGLLKDPGTEDPVDVAWMPVHRHRFGETL